MIARAAMGLALGALLAGCPKATPAASPAPAAATGEAAWETEIIEVEGEIRGATARRGSLAVLGLEVVDNGAADEKAVRFAVEFSDLLRMRARAGGAPFSVAPGTGDKDLQELKFLRDCESEAPACMAAIGDDFAADFVLYGKVEKHKLVYQVSLKLLDVEAEKVDRAVSDVVPHDATSRAVSAAARKLYVRLAGSAASGQIVIVTELDRGTVYVDGEAKGTLKRGTALIQGIEEGEHTLGVETTCHGVAETRVNVLDGQATRATLTLPPCP